TAGGRASLPAVDASARGLLINRTIAQIRRQGNHVALFHPLPHLVVGEGLFSPLPHFVVGEGLFSPLPHFVVGEGRVRVLIHFKQTPYASKPLWRTLRGRYASWLNATTTNPPAKS